MIDPPPGDTRIETVPPGGVIADEQDVASLYNLVLRRNPEGQRVVMEQVGRPVMDIFFSFLSSAEFYQRVLPSVISKTMSGSIYTGTQSLEQLLAWAAARPLPLRPELRQRLVRATSWHEFEEVLFSDTELLDQFPKIRDSGAARAVALRKLDTEALETIAEIRGAVDYANVWEIRGWCADARNLHARLSVDIFADNDLIGTVVCSEYRRDLQEKLGGDGNFGFTFTIPAAVQEAFQTERRIIVRECSGGAAIGNAVFVRGDLPRRINAIDTVRDEVVRAKNTIAKLEQQLAQLASGMGYPLQAYDEYVRTFDQLAPETIAEYQRNMLRFGLKPTISIVLMLSADAPELLDASVQSIQDQLYTGWELVVIGVDSCLSREMKARLSALRDTVAGSRVQLLMEAANAAALMREGLALCQGGFVIFLRAGDRLAPDALYQNLVRIQQPGIKVLYADEDRYYLDETGSTRYHSPRLKPDPDLDYLLSDNYIGRLVLFDRALLAGIDGPGQDIAGAEELDLLLKAIDAAGMAGVAHIPRALYHIHQAQVSPAPADDPAESVAVCQVVNGYLMRNGLAAVAEPHADPFGRARPSATRLKWSLRESAPTVSLIIPTKDHPELLGPCLASILATTADYPGEVEVLVLDNGTTDPIARALLRTLAERGSIRIMSYPGPFNWAAMNNRAVSLARGEILLFLNNDVLAITQGWLDELVGQALRPEIGAVGARLLYADDTIQHAGMVLGIAGSTCHEAIGEPVSDGGYLGRSQLQRRVAAVTGACLATRRDVFERVEGFDEAVFKIVFNDTDYCLKAGAAGFGVMYTPFATLHHFESVSRGFDSTNKPGAGEDQQLLAFREKWRERLRYDPHYNPNFELSARPFKYLKVSRQLPL